MAILVERHPHYVDHSHKTAIPTLASVALVLFLAVLCLAVLITKT